MEITLDDKLKYMQAARRGDLATIKELVKNGMPVDSFKNGALLEACYYGHLPVVAFLVESKIDINKHDGLALYLTFQRPFSSMAEYLIRKDGINNFKPETMTHKDSYPTNILDYLIKEENYIAYGLGKNDRKIIDWCETYMLEQERMLKAEVLPLEVVATSNKKSKKMKK